jgi:uncharacterized membrane protein
MAYQQATADGRVSYAGATIRRISTPDLFTVLSKGLADFNKKPSHLMFLMIIYPIVAFILARLSFGYDVLPLLFPLAAGFTLLGPIAAIGIYELSRRQELGEDVGWSHAFGVLKSPSLGAIIQVGLILAAIFVLWLIVAYGIYLTIFGNAAPDSFGAFANQILFTPQGWLLIVIGNAVGFLFALAVLAISVVSIPMLLDRRVSAGTAMATSVAATRANPVPILAWGLIVAIGLVVGSIPFFVGLCIVLPVLGHATWHLYRELVAW